MVPIDRHIRRLLCLTTLLFCAWACPAAFGQDGEEIVDDGPIVPQAVMPVQVARAVQFNPEQVDQWIFSRWGGPAGAKIRLEANLALRIDDIDRRSLARAHRVRVACAASPYIPARPAPAQRLP